MKNIRILFLTLLMAAAFLSCSKKKEDLDQPLNGLGGDTWTRSSIDQWLYDSLLAPNNIEVKYKWDQSEFDMAYTLVPPQESKVIPAANAVIKMWIDVYNEAAGTKMFMKQYSPKQIMLSGGLAINSDGSAVQGLAEGGLKILLFGINAFNSKSRADVTDMAHLIHHEFTHILNQRIAYPVEYNTITPDKYTSGWTIVTENPWTLGFVSNYSRKDPGEDIAELVSWMLVMGKKAFDQQVMYPYASAPTTPNNADAIAKLRRKEAIVVRYFKEAYKIDIYDLQQRVQDAIDALTH